MRVTILMMLVTVLLTTQAGAGEFSKDLSTFSYKLGGYPPIVVGAQDGPSVSINPDTHVMLMDSDIWITTNYSGGSSAFTGVPFIDDMFFTFQNQAGTFRPNFMRPNPIGPGTLGGFGGVAVLKGRTVIKMIGPIHMYLDPVAGDDITDVAGMLLVTVWKHGAAWGTVPVVIDDITTTVLSVTSGPREGVQGPSWEIGVTVNEGFAVYGERHFNGSTTTIQTRTHVRVRTEGWFDIDENGVGSVRLVAPIRIRESLGVIGSTPAVAVKTVYFVPEPAKMLLLSSGIVFLLGVARVKARA